jgi:hypothetical protein
MVERAMVERAMVERAMVICDIYFYNLRNYYLFFLKYLSNILFIFMIP